MLRNPNAVMSIGFVIRFPHLREQHLRRARTSPDGYARSPTSTRYHLATAERELMAGPVAATQLLWILGACAVPTGLFAH